MCLGLDHVCGIFLGVDLSDFSGLEQLAQRVPGLLSLFWFGPFFSFFLVWTIFCGRFFGFGLLLW